MTDAPVLWLNGRQLTGLKNDIAPVLAPVNLTWGASSAVEQPTPSNLNFTLLFKEGMFDVPDLTKGAKIELYNPVNGRVIFAGVVRTLSAEPSTQLAGALVVTANATDYTAELDAEYMSTDWPASTGRVTHLVNAFATAGWWLQLPATELPSAAAKYNSIKLSTMLDRHISRYRGRRYDTSHRTPEGEVVRRVTVMEGTARQSAPDTLVADNNRAWTKQYNTPNIDGEPSPLIELPATNVLRDPSWTQEPDNAITAVVLSTMGLGDDGFTELTERNYRASSAVVNAYGLQPVAVETDLQNSADYATAANAWMTDDSPWKMSGLSIHDSEQISQEQLNLLLDTATRYLALITVTGIMPNRPDPGPSDLRSYLMGGSYVWTGKKWILQLELERTITALATAGDYWTCANVGASTDPNIQQATCATVGDTLTVADFLFIGAP